MLRERFSKDVFEKIFQTFNEAVYRGEMNKLNYKSWRNIKNWLSDEKYPQMEVSKEWVRIRDDVSDTNIYAYHDEERIFVGPYDPVCCCPNPEELDPEDKSLGTWLDGVLNRKRMMANLSSSFENIGYSATQLADSCTKLSDAYYTTDTISGYGVGLLDNYKCAPCTIELNTDSLTLNGKPMEDYIREAVEKIHNNEKENNKMMKFDFGPVDSSVHMSLYGMAIKNASGTYVAYDVKTGSIMDVDIINFEGANKFMYKMPVVLSAVQIGDVIVHSKHPMFVSEVDIETNRMVAVDIYDGEEKVIVPTQSPFGFSFITKVVSLINFVNSADASNPFGNMLPFLLMSDSKNNDSSMLMAMAMTCGHTDMMKNPMLVYALMSKDGKMNDMLPFMLMGGFGANPNGCCGNCSCDKDK